MIITVQALFNGEPVRVISKPRTIAGLKRAASRAALGDGWGVRIESNADVSTTLAALRRSVPRGFAVQSSAIRPVVQVADYVGNSRFFPCEILCNLDFAPKASK
jgi:hypothetical protein